MSEIELSHSKSDLALPAVNSGEGKIVKIKTGRSKRIAANVSKTAKKKTPTKLAVSDELFLDTVRDDVYRKLKAGEFDLSLSDGFKSIDLKNKISSPQPDNRLAMLLEELRRELMK